ncbi:MAG: DsbA family protein [Nitrosarchaeum sp.]|nr:MAG: DsbA family protein [Nitrosarchaeum sp.]
MGKNKQESNKTKVKSNKTKFIIIGSIVAIIMGISAAFSTNDITSDNTQNTRLSIDTTKGSPLLGSESAQVTIIEFGDYQCPFCQKWNQNTKPLIEKNYIDTGKVNLIYVDFPIVGPDSIKVHAGSYCAAEQGLYWQYHDFVYANQGHENNGWAGTNNLKNLVSGINGLDVDSFSKCLDSGKYEDRVKENKDIASKNGAKSTPSFIVIGSDGRTTPISGAQPYSVFQQTIDRMLT